MTACFSCRASLLVARSASSDRACSCQHSLMNSRCVLDSCCSGLWSSFKHLAGFLKLKRMPWVEPFVHQASDRHRRGAVGTSTRAVACALTNICFTKLKRFTFFIKKKKHPGSDVFVFLGNKPVSRRSTSLTFQGDFCVSMIGRGGALRCKNQRDCCTDCSQCKRRGKPRTSGE